MRWIRWALTGLMLWIVLPPCTSAHAFEPVNSVRLEVRTDGWTLHEPDGPRAFALLDMGQVDAFFKSTDFILLSGLVGWLHVNPRAGSMHMVTVHVDADPLLPYSTIRPILHVLREAGFFAFATILSKPDGARLLEFTTVRQPCIPKNKAPKISAPEEGNFKDFGVSLDVLLNGFPRPCHELTIWLAPTGAWAQWDEHWTRDTTCRPPNSVSAHMLALELSGDAPLTTLPIALDPKPAGEHCDRITIATQPDVLWRDVVAAIDAVEARNPHPWPRPYIGTRTTGSTTDAVQPQP